jgi:hypothetical protein
MIRFLLVVLVLFAAGPAHAHTRSQSMSHWRVEGDALVGRVEADALDVTRLYALGGDAAMAETFARHAGASFTVGTEAGPCAMHGAAAPTPAGQGRLAVQMRFDCPAGALTHDVSLRSTLFFAVAPTHLHFTAVNGPHGGGEAVLTDAHRGATFSLLPGAKAEGAWATFRRYVPVGMTHVWGGLDHLAFILGLTLLARGLAAAAIAALGFTLGHTATLALAALGVLAPDSPTVEALIGFTVAFVALEAAQGDTLRRWATPLAVGLLGLAALTAVHLVVIAALSLVGLAVFSFAYPRGFLRGAAGAPWLAAAFGLVHGCGFAGALSALDLPRPRLLAALAGFNIGVELAQVVVILAAFAVGAAWRRLAPPRLSVAGDVVAASLFAVGTYWFVSRAFGL